MHFICEQFGALTLEKFMEMAKQSADLVKGVL